MKITDDSLKRALAGTLENNDISFREQYTGRGMGRSYAWGVIAYSEKTLAEFEVRLATESVAEGEVMVDSEDLIDKFVDISDARHEDSMGRSIIWYYPRLEITNDNEG